MTGNTAFSSGRPKKDSPLKNFITQQREKYKSFMRLLTPEQLQAVLDTVTEDWSMYSFSVRYDGLKAEISFNARRGTPNNIVVQGIKVTV